MTLDLTRLTMEDDAPGGSRLILSELDMEGDLPSPRAAAFLEQAQKTDPEMAAKARRTGLPASFGTTDPDLVNLRDTRSRQGWDTLEQDSPKVAQFLKNPDTSAVAHRDVSNLRKIEQKVREVWSEEVAPLTFGKFTDALAGGVISGGASFLQGTGEIVESLSDIIRSNFRHSFGQRGEEFMAVTEAAVGRTFGTFYDAIMGKEKLTWEDDGRPSLAPSPYSSGPDILRDFGDKVQAFSERNFEPVREDSPFALKVTGALGGLANQLVLAKINPLAASTYLASLGAKEQADLLEKAEADITAQERATGVLAGTAVTPITQMPVLERLLARVPEAARGRVAKTVLDLLQSGSWEAVQELIEGELQSSITSAVTGESTENSNSGEDLAVAFVVGMIARGAVISIQTAAKDSAREDTDAAVRQGETEAQKLEELITLAQSSEVARLDPEAFGRLMQEMEIGETEIFLSRERAQQILEEFEGVTEADDATVDLLHKRISDTLPGEQIVISGEEAMSTVFQSGLAESLRDSMTVTPEAVSPSEAEQFSSEQDALLDRLVEQAMSRGEMAGESAAIYEDVLAQLVEQGNLDAKDYPAVARFAAAWAVSKAEREGKTPSQVYEESGFKVLRDEGENRTGLANETFTQSAGFEPVSAEDFISSVEAVRASGSRGMGISAQTVESLEGAQMFLADEGRVGFAVKPDGELVSVFKHPDSPLSEVMPELLSLAAEAGATNLSTFEGPVADLYRSSGWVETGRAEFDDQLAPEGGDTEQGGRPDVLTMRLDGRESDGSLKGLPRVRGASAFRPAQAVAEQYMASRGETYSPPSNYANVDVARAARIAEEYDKAEHRPDDPEVKASYEAMVAETIEQYKAILETGLQVEFINPQDGDPYAETPRMSTEDVRENNHLYVFSTMDGFGSDQTFDPSQNPLLGATEFTDINGKPMLANDVFRVVHDYFGHVKEGVGFRADGEENAWRAHASMYSPLARRAMTSETRGQNSWVNFGPYGETNLSSKPEDTRFADQKTTLLPEWVSEEGRTDAKAAPAPVPSLEQRQVSVVNGWYTPGTGVIRLTRSESRATMLHELAHFMLDMEAKDGQIWTEVRQWLQREGVDAFSEEAHRYTKRIEASFESGISDTYSPSAIEAVQEGKIDGPWGFSFRRAEDWASKYEGNPDIAEMPDHSSLVDLDKPLSEQPEILAKAILLGYDAPNLTGRQFYDAMKMLHGGRKNASAQMEQAGILGSVEAWSDGKENTTLWGKNLIDSRDADIQLNEIDALAYYKSQGPLDTRITEASVQSFLETGTTGDTALDWVYETALHEKFARGWETYLMEGKSPSVEMQGVFRKISQWVQDVYAALKGDLNVKLDDEIRRLFDSLISTPEQVNRLAEQTPDLFSEADLLGMTDRQYKSYLERKDKLKEKAEESVRDKIAKEIRRRLAREYRDRVAEAEATILEEVQQEQVFAARRAIAERFPLDTAAVRELVGIDGTLKDGTPTRTIPHKIRTLVRSGGNGLDPDQVASFLNYRSGKEMLEDILANPTEKQEAHRRAVEEVNRTHGELVDEQAIAEEVKRAVESEVDEQVILEQLRALNQTPAQKELAWIREQASSKIEAMPLAEVRPSVYRRAYVKAAKAAAVAASKGDKAEAVKQKRRQVMFLNLERAATKALNEANSVREWAARLDKPKSMSQIAKEGGGFAEQINRIIVQFGLGKGKQLVFADDTGLSLSDFVKARLVNFGDRILAGQDTIAETKFDKWNSATVAQLRGAKETLQSLRNMSKQTSTATLEGEAVAFEDLVNQVVGVISSGKTKPPKDPTIAGEIEDGTLASIRSWGRRMIAEQTKIPWLMSFLNGYERVGLLHQIFIQPEADAYHHGQELIKSVAKPIADALSARTPEQIKRHGKVHVIDLGEGRTETMRGSQILMYALNMGNLGNRSKLQKGRGFVREGEDSNSVTEDSKRILASLTREDWDFVQLVWDRLDTLHPELSALHERVTGKPLGKVERAKVETPFGTLEGGYFPLKQRRNVDEKVSADEDTDQMFAETDIFSNVNVSTSATKERTEAEYAVSLDLGLLTSHVREVTHYIAYYDFVRAANRLIRDPRVEAAIVSRTSQEDFNQLRPWLVSIARDGRESSPKNFMGDVMEHLRTGSTMVAMGYKAGTTMMQLLGLYNSAAEVGPVNLLKGLTYFIDSPTGAKEAVDFAMSRSKILGTRIQSFDREVQNAVSRVHRGESLLDKYRDLAFAPIGYVQLYAVDLPTWHGAFSKEMAISGDESKAAQYADWVVENVQGSARTANASALMRSKNQFAQTLTMFMTFFSSLFNASRDLTRRVKEREMSVVQATSATLFMFVAPVITEMLLRGKWPDDDDDDAKLKIAAELLSYPLASMPVVRDFASAPAMTQFLGGERDAAGYQFSPVVRSIVDTGTALGTVAEVFKDDGEITEAQTKATIRAIGAWLHLPGTGQAVASGGHILKWLEEGEEFSIRQSLLGPDRQK